MKYAQLVVGPAGCGKSTYCHTIQKHAETINRTVNVVNLDPAAEGFKYTPSIDVQNLIRAEEAMEVENLGPNGALVYCMEFLLDNMDFLEGEIENTGGDYYIFDCPGQIELYAHLDVMSRFVEQLKRWDFNICAVYVLDTQFMLDGHKFMGGILSSLSAMMNFQIPYISILSKIDLLSKSMRKKIDDYLDPDIELLTSELKATVGPKYASFAQALANVLADYSMVQFYPFNINDEETVETTLLQIDFTIQYGEDADIKTRDFEEEDDDA